MNRPYLNWRPFPLGLIVIGVLWPLGIAAATVVAMNVSRDFRPDDITIATVLAVCLLGILFVAVGLIQMKSLQRLPPRRVVLPVVAVALLWLGSFAVSAAIILAESMKP